MVFSDSSWVWPMDAHPVMIRPSKPRPTQRPDMFSPCGCSTKYMVPLDRIDHLTFGPPKTQAGKRTVALPDLIIPVIGWHLGNFTQPGDDALVFTSPTGKLLRHGLFRSRVWVKATHQVGLPDLHFHDLRHTGNMLTAATGATLRELMDRMGHSTTRAALIYLHGSDARQHEIAGALSHQARQQVAGLAGSVNTEISQATGTYRARQPEPAHQR